MLLLVWGVQQSTLLIFLLDWGGAACSLQKMAGGCILYWFLGRILSSSQMKKWWCFRFTCVCEFLIFTVQVDIPSFQRKEGGKFSLGTSIISAKLKCIRVGEINFSHGGAAAKQAAHAMRKIKGAYSCLIQVGWHFGPRSLAYLSIGQQISNVGWPAVG